MGEGAVLHIDHLARSVPYGSRQVRPGNNVIWGIEMRLQHQAVIRVNSLALQGNKRTMVIIGRPKWASYVPPIADDGDIIRIQKLWCAADRVRFDELRRNSLSAAA